MTPLPAPEGAESITEAGSAEAKAACEHFYASHCYRGMSVRLCMMCHEPDWDDLAAQLADAATVDAEPSRAESPAPEPARPGAASTSTAEALPAAAVLDRAGQHVTCDTAIAGLRAERDEARAKLLEYENAITWGTDCLSCSQTLDRAYAETERAERAEAKLADIRGFLRDTMADPESSAIETTAAMSILAIAGTGEGDDRG